MASDTVRGILARAILELAPSESARADAQLLLAHALGQAKTWLISHSDAPLSATQSARYWELVKKRSAGAPVAYITGSWGFYGREFEVTPRVLVPRKETEHLLDTAIAYLKNREKNDATRTFSVLDVGTGSGAIACTIAVECGFCTVSGTDASEFAIQVAQRNAQRFGVAGRCAFYFGDLAAPVTGGRFDCVVANLPYVPTAQIAAAPDPVSYEPRAALDGGADGLALYRRLLPQLPALLGADALVLLEAAPPTIGELRALALERFPGASIAVERDYADLERFVSIRLARPA